MIILYFEKSKIISTKENFWIQKIFIVMNLVSSKAKFR